MKETAYLLQAALISVWWLGLVLSQTFFRAFQFDDIGPLAFWSFLAPDVLVITLCSVVRAYRKWPELEWIVLGAFAYGTFYCVNASFLTQSGFLPTGLMLVGLGYNLFLCFDKRAFQQASQKNLYRNCGKTLVQIVCIWFLTLVLTPYVILQAFGSWALPPLGIMTAVAGGLFCVSSLLGLFSAWVMVRDGQGTPLPLDQTNYLVTRGPYQYVRNPMAIAGIGQGIAVGILFGSWPVVVYAFLGAVIWNFVIRPFEEKDMARRFGKPYENYCENVRCWIPRLTFANMP
jgi:protein-S-isoprenylcysteine O-methyltransferase Ste14